MVHIRVEGLESGMVDPGFRRFRGVMVLGAWRSALVPWYKRCRG